MPSNLPQQFPGHEMYQQTRYQYIYRFDEGFPVPSEVVCELRKHNILLAGLAPECSFAGTDLLLDFSKELLSKLYGAYDLYFLFNGVPVFATPLDIKIGYGVPTVGTTLVHTSDIIFTTVQLDSVTTVAGLVAQAEGFKDEAETAVNAAASILADVEQVMDDILQGPAKAKSIATYAAMLASPEGFYKVVADENSGGSDVVYYWDGEAAVRLSENNFTDRLYNVLTNVKTSYPNARQLIVFTGDSITRGIGTSGTGSSSTDPPIIGNNTYPKQTIQRLNNDNVDNLVFGFSGRTSRWFIDNELENVISLIDFDSFDEVIVAIFFGANDLSNYSNTFDTIYQDLLYIHTRFRSLGCKTICIPALSRHDSTTASMINHIEINRRRLNQLLVSNWASFASEYAHLENQQPIFDDLSPESSIYFARNDVDGLSKVHLTDAGARLLAEEVAQSVARINRQTLAYSENLGRRRDSDVIAKLISIDFPVNVGMRQTGKKLELISPNGVLWDGKSGVSRYKIAAGSDGYIQSFFPNLTTMNGMIALKSNNDISQYQQFNYHTWSGAPNGSTSVSVGFLNTLISNVTNLSVGGYLRLVRINGVVLAQKSVDGTVWIDYYTFPTQNNDDLFIVTELRGDGSLYDLRGYNLTPC